MTSCVDQRDRKVVASANEAASSPRNAAVAAAARAASASSAGPATSGAASAARAASAAASVLYARLARFEVFPVENKERRQADVHDFFFTESDVRARRGTPYIRHRSNVSRRGCSSRQRHRHADDSRNRDGLLQVLLLFLPHVENLLRVERIVPAAVSYACHGHLQDRFPTIAGVRKLGGRAREKPTWPILMAVSSGTS